MHIFARLTCAPGIESVLSALRACIWHMLAAVLIRLYMAHAKADVEQPTVWLHMHMQWVAADLNLQSISTHTHEMMIGIRGNFNGKMLMCPSGALGNITRRLLMLKPGLPNSS